MQAETPRRTEALPDGVVEREDELVAEIFQGIGRLEDGARVAAVLCAPSVVDAEQTQGLVGAEERRAVEVGCEMRAVVVESQPVDRFIFGVGRRRLHPVDHILSAMEEPVGAQAEARCRRPLKAEAEGIDLLGAQLVAALVSGRVVETVGEGG